MTTSNPTAAAPPPENILDHEPLFISLRFKLLFTFLLLFVLVFGGSYYWFYTFSDDLVQNKFYDFSTDAAMDRLQEDLGVLLEGVSGQIDGDDFEALVAEGEVREDGYTDDPRYWEQAELLFMMRNVDPRARFFTYTSGDEENEIVFVGSSGALLEEPVGARFLESFVYPPADAAVLLAGLDGVEYYLDIYEDPNFPGQQWISGYAPITNSDGETVGALGIDFRADYVRRVQRDLETKIEREVESEVRQGIALAALINSVLVVSIIFVTARVLTRPVQALTQAARRIGEGDYSQDFSALTAGRTTDEIGTLARVFEIMVSKVRQREERLKKQVSELQIMIDDTRRQEQVEEIVETDFFRDLQQKARTMREGFTRARSGGGGGDGGRAGTGGEVESPAT